MKKDTQKQAALQLTIKEWMKGIPRLKPLFSDDGVFMGDGYLTADHVSMHAATAAYHAVLAAMEYADLAMDLPVYGKYCPTCKAGEEVQIPLGGYPGGKKDHVRRCGLCGTKWMRSAESFRDDDREGI